MSPKTTDSTPSPALSRSECLQEIPSSVADSLEGKDYIHYFCGLECYAVWEEQNDRRAAGDIM